MTEHGSSLPTRQLLERNRRRRIWWAQVIGLSAFVVAVALALWWHR